MRYLPFEHIIYTTHLSEEEVMDILSRCVGQKSGRIFRNSPVKAYEGYINGSRFTISRVVKNRNAFVPRITGTVQQDNTETRIEIKMQLSALVNFFSILFCLMAFSFLIAGMMRSDQDDGDALLAAGMLSGIYLLMMLGFKTESKKSGQLFEKLFDAKIISAE